MKLLYYHIGAVYYRHTRGIIRFFFKTVMPSVIIVDDDRGTLELFDDFLDQGGIEVIGKARNGKAAVELFINSRPDIVLLDVLMPEYDGLYALEKIREIDPDAKVIMVTADLTADTEKKLQELNATAVIYKPYEIGSVLDTIDKVNKGVLVAFNQS